MILMLTLVVQFGLGLSIDHQTIDNPLFVQPIQVQILKGETWVLDRKAKCLIQPKSNQKIGNDGQGPGEFLDPIAFQASESGFKVFDGSRGQLVIFDKSGVFVNNILLSRASSALFFQDVIVLYTPTGTNLFEKFDLNGNRLGAYGKGMGPVLDLKDLSNYMFAYTVSSDSDIFAAGLDGKKFSIFGENGNESSFSLDFMYETFYLPQKTVQQGASTFVIDHEQPILGIALYDQHILVLAENEKEEATYLQVFDLKGKLANMILLDGYYKKMNIINNEIFFFDTSEGTIRHYRLEKL